MLDALGLNLKEIIFVIINFLILVGVLGKFLYQPFLGAIEARKQNIKDAYDKAAIESRRADAKMAKYERRIANQEFLCARPRSEDLFDPVTEQDLSRRNKAVIAAAQGHHKQL